MPWPSKNQSKRKRKRTPKHEPAGSADSEAGPATKEPRIFEKLDATNEKDRRVGCLSIASLAGEGSAEDQAKLLELGVVIKLMQCLQNDGTLVKVAAVGALRNLAIGSAPGREDILLVGALREMLGQLQLCTTLLCEAKEATVETKEHGALMLELLETMRALCEESAAATDAVSDPSILRCVLRLLGAVGARPQIECTAAGLLYTIADDNPKFVSFFLSEDCAPLLELKACALADNAPPLLCTSCAMSAVAVIQQGRLSCSVHAEDSSRTNWTVPLLDRIALKDSDVLLQALLTLEKTFAKGGEGEGKGVDAAASAQMMTQDGDIVSVGDAATVGQNAVKEAEKLWSDSVRAQMLALETLSNIACAAVEPDGGEGPPAEVEGEGDGERDLARDMLALCGKNVAGRVLAVGARECAGLAPRRQRLLNTLQHRSLHCYSNLVSATIEVPPSAAWPPLLSIVTSTLKELEAVPLRHGDCNKRLGAAGGAFLATLQYVPPDESIGSSLPGGAAADTELVGVLVRMMDALIAHLKLPRKLAGAEAGCADALTNVLGAMLLLLGCETPELHTVDVLAVVGAALLRVLECASAGPDAGLLPAAWQAMDVIFEVFGADGDAVETTRRKLDLCAQLVRIVPLVEKLNNETPECEHEEEFARAAIANAKGFIEYIQ